MTAATEHGRRVNVSKARGDQSGYLGDAERVYNNWQGAGVALPIGERNRMPLYAGYLALFYHRGLSDPDFFVVGRQANIYLSVGLLALIGIVLGRELPTLAALNLTGIAAFGYFIFKAGYTQSELLFYALFFLAFLGCWHLLRSPDSWRTLALAALTGALLGLAHLTKAAVPPFIILVLCALMAEPMTALVTRGPGSANGIRHLLWRTAAGVTLGLAFLAVLSPYLATNKRHLGRYFFNVNSTFYVWYDDWAHASMEMAVLGDGQKWPDLPASSLPGPGRYWREHSLGRIATRLAGGFQDMAIVSYTTYNYLLYLLIYLGAVLLVALMRPALIADMVRAHGWLAAFLVAYGVLYLFATAFYFPISGTGTARFLMAHLLPLFFVLSRVLTSARLTNLRWTPFGVPVTLAHFHVVVTTVLTLDVLLHVWPRLMTTYGGF